MRESSCWFCQSLPECPSLLHVILQIPRRCKCLSTFLTRMMRPSLVDWFHRCIAVPIFTSCDYSNILSLSFHIPGKSAETTRWLSSFTDALQSGDKRTTRREVGVRQRSCSCTEHLAGEMFRLPCLVEHLAVQMQEMFTISMQWQFLDRN